MKTWHIILILILCLLCFLAGRHTKRAGWELVGKTDTLIIIDTVRDSVPFPVKEVITKYVSLSTDTVVKYLKGDTVYLPIVQKEYLTDNYHAWVSGYNSALDSIDIFPKTVYITKRQPARRWGLGVIGGYGVGRSGLSPYVGVGVYYRIW